MPKKKPGMTPEQQREEFERTVRALADAGDIDPIEAAATFEKLMERVKVAKA